MESMHEGEWGAAAPPVSTTLTVALPDGKAQLWPSRVLRHPEFSRCTRVALDFNGVERFDLEELEALAFLLRYLPRQGKSVELAPLPEEISKLLGRLGLLPQLQSLMQSNPKDDCLQGCGTPAW